ncbi:MAG: hypothetical protein HC916_13225 [Coleofasciculaceae cyanobacterium SM2_1_6]|nr:hypothetical protein [Coleofasciculaceae cyanobacterium SM2_1_6]
MKNPIQNSIKKALFLSCSSLLFPLGQSALTLPAIAQTPSIVQPSLLPESVTPNTTPENVTPSIVTPAIPRIEILSTGTGEKTQLRFTPVVNSRQTSTLTLKLDAKEGMSIALPTTKLTMEVVITRVDANGDIYFDFTYKNVDILAEPGTPREEINALRPSLTPLIGLNGSIVVNSRGQTKSTQINIPPELDPTAKEIFEQFSTSLDQFYAPLPEEAVGIGARWRVSEDLNVNGIQLTQSAIYELVSNQNNVLELMVLVEQEALPQAVTLPSIPDLPAGATLELRSLSSQGEGEMTFGLGQILPRRSILSSRSSVVLSFKPAENEQGISVNQDIAVEVILNSQP